MISAATYYAGCVSHFFPRQVRDGADICVVEYKDVSGDVVVYDKVGVRCPQATVSCKKSIQPLWYKLGQLSLFSNLVGNYTLYHVIDMVKFKRITLLLAWLEVLLT